MSEYYWYYKIDGAIFLSVTIQDGKVLSVWYMGHFTFPD